MDRYQASVVNRLTDKGAGWGLIGLLIVHWPKVAGQPESPGAALGSSAS